MVILKHTCALQLRAEQRRVVEKHGAGYSRAAMGAMRYADALAREVLRIWGPADVLFRYASPDHHTGECLGTWHGYACCRAASHLW